MLHDPQLDPWDEPGPTWPAAYVALLTLIALLAIGVAASFGLLV